MFPFFYPLHQVFPALAHTEAEVEQLRCRTPPPQGSQLVDGFHIGFQVRRDIAVQYILPFLDLALAPLRADAVIVVIDNRLRNVAEAQPAADGLETVGPVAGYQVALVVGVAVEDLAAEERCLMVDDVVDEIVETDGVGIVLVDVLPVGIEQVGIAIEDVGVGVFVAEQMLERRVGKETVAAVKYLDIIATGVGDAFVDGVVDAFVRLAAPVGRAVGIAFNLLAAAVGASAVDDDPLEVGERLGKNTFGRAPQPVQIVKIDGYDGKFHKTGLWKSIYACQPINTLRASHCVFCLSLVITVYCRQ